MQEKLEEIRKSAKKEIEEIDNQDQLEAFRRKFLARKGELSSILRKLKDLSLEERKKIGILANQVKKEITDLIEEKNRKLEQEVTEKEKAVVYDPTLIVETKKIGKLNILSQTQREIEKIFSSMGFEIADGPEVENEWYNFTALNVPKDHPARDMQDTFWIKQENRKETDPEKRKILPRTQTSNVQVRYLEKNQPPFRIIVPGRVFRNEATDANHEHTFYQFEALVVGKNISVANFKHIAQEFFSIFLGQRVGVRLRPSYFPFTEPSFEFDISCTVCGGEGCRSCKNSGWLEVGGAGMVNQQVFLSAGYKRNQWQGFAWGFGIERLAMMKYKIKDIRLFKSGDIRFLEQF